MIRSLYIRVILTYLLSVIVGSVIAYTLAVWAYNEKLNENSQVLLMNFGQDIVRLYETMPENMANEYISGIKQLDSYHVRIYDKSGLVSSYGALKDHLPATVTVNQVNQVLHGGMVQINAGGGVTSILLGLPLETEAGSKALFVAPRTPPSAAFAKQFVLTFLVLFFIVGSLLILGASIFLVKPINKLTRATKRIASGDFDVQLNIRQPGELGTLAKSFEHMSHDLQQLEVMRREFVANVSHEVQSPLTSISGYALALKQMNMTAQNRDRYLDIIIEEANRMSKMTEGLLKLSQLESETQQLRMTTFKLDEQIRRVIVAIQPQWAARDIHFDLDFEETSLIGDYDLLQQVWTNLISNSIKFSQMGGVIAVHIEQDTEDVTVRISDKGIGILPEDQERIFERFFKADRSHSRKHAGSGMGLAIAKQIVALHQGSIFVDSLPDQGTTMTVVLAQALEAE